MPPIKVHFRCSNPTLLCTKSCINNSELLLWRFWLKRVETFLGEFMDVYISNYGMTLPFGMLAKRASVLREPLHALVHCHGSLLGLFRHFLRISSTRLWLLWLLHWVLFGFLLSVGFWHHDSVDLICKRILSSKYGQHHHFNWTSPLLVKLLPPWIHNTYPSTWWHGLSQKWHYCYY